MTEARKVKCLRQRRWTVVQAGLQAAASSAAHTPATAGPGCSPHTRSMLLGYSATCICGFPAFYFLLLYELVYYFSPHFGLNLHFPLFAWRVKELFPVTFSCSICNFSSEFPYYTFSCLFHKYWNTRFSLLFLQNFKKLSLMISSFIYGLFVFFTVQIFGQFCSYFSVIDV